MSIPKKYKPIDCSLHEILLDRSTRRKEILVKYLSFEGKKSQISGVIVDVFTKNHEEFLKLDSGDLIRLDHLINVDDVDFLSGKHCVIDSKKEK